MPIQDSLLQMQEGMAAYIRALNAQKRALLRRIKLANKLKSDLKKLADDNTGEELTDDLARLAADITAAAQQLGPDLSLASLVATPAQQTRASTKKNNGSQKRGRRFVVGTSTGRAPAARRAAQPTPAKPVEAALPAAPVESPSPAAPRARRGGAVASKPAENSGEETATETRRYFGMAPIAGHFLIPAFGPDGLPDTLEEALDRMAAAHPTVYPEGWRVKTIRVLNDDRTGFESRTIEADIARSESSARHLILQGVQRGLMVMNDQAPAGKTVKPSLRTLAELFRKLDEADIAEALTRWGILSNSTEVEADE